MLPPIDGEPDPNGADCVACGRCCHHGPQTVHLLESDDARLGEILLERYTEVAGGGRRRGHNDCNDPGSLGGGEPMKPSWPILGGVLGLGVAAFWYAARNANAAGQGTASTGPAAAGLVR